MVDLASRSSAAGWLLQSKLTPAAHNCQPTITKGQLPQYVPLEDPDFPARVEAQQRSRVVPGAQGGVRARRADADAGAARQARRRLRDVRTRADFRTQGVAVSDLP